jgi:hypothetical protein
MKYQTKIMSTFATSLVVILLLITGCGKKASVSSPKASSKLENQIPRKLKALNISQAEDFAILAYASISSIPNSAISGKVGLLPGTRDQITLGSTEVAGGATDIIASDDETIPTNLLSNAKVDMVTAYKEAVNLTPDTDKIGLYEGMLNGQILAGGCYKWNGDLNISKDFTIEGSASDIWVFKIAANFKVGSDVHLTLRGGANAKNIFWQVAGSAVIESGSTMAGTIIAQQSVVMKNHSELIGRTFAKNGYINLNQAKITKP